MSIDLLLSIAQLVGIVSVVASVVFLALETRTSSKNQSLNAYSVAVSLMVQPISDMKKDPVLIDLYMRGLTDFEALSNEEKWRFGAMMQEYCWAFHAFWRWDDSTILSETDRKLTPEDMPSIRAIIGRPGFQSWWEKGQSSMPNDFVAFLGTMSDLNKLHGAPRMSSIHNEK